MAWYATLIHFHPWMRASTSDENGAMVKAELLRFNGAVERDPAIDAWMKEHAGELGAIAHQWFEVMRKCGEIGRASCRKECA